MAQNLINKCCIFMQSSKQVITYIHEIPQTFLKVSLKYSDLELFLSAIVEQRSKRIQSCFLNANYEARILILI